MGRLLMMNLYFESKTSFFDKENFLEYEKEMKF